MIILAVALTHVAVAASAGGVPGWFVYLYYITAICTGAGAIIAGYWKLLLPSIRWFKHFREDWNGEAPRPSDGYDGRPGAMKRLATMEMDIKDIKAELHPNHGGSLKDQMNELIDWKRKNEQDEKSVKRN